MVFFLFETVFAIGQELHHQMISSGGSVNKLKTGHYISQTIGQQSIVGSRSNQGYQIFQGFQQGLWSTLIQEAKLTQPNAILVYPNPVREIVNFQFSETLSGSIQILFFDTLGRLISHTITKSTDNSVRMTLNFLAPGMYLVQLKHKERTHYTKLLKID